jgi:hypothetical protein
VTADVFGTRALRDRVLGTWRTDPARLREDANTEEDHARGYYRDRVVVELAQNAADAAVRARVPGRLLLRLTETPDGSPGVDGAAGPAGPAGPAGVAVLLAANTGAPLDAAGVASLAAMRASSARDWDAGTGTGPGLVGRFGVGFAAVRAVADEVEVLSTTGAVRFSLAETRRDLALAATDARLADEVARREGALPALRLPREHTGRPPEGYDTAVVLALRDDAAVDSVRSMLAEVGDALLLALPGLTEVVVEDELAGVRRRVADVDRRWRRLTAEGELDPALVTDRPVEERGRRGWRVTWALPREVPAVWPDGAAAWEAAPDGASDAVRGSEPAGARWERVVHAPTPTDDALELPALLVATLPLDPTRRHVARGRATDALLDIAGELYARLAAACAADGEDALRLVPRGLPASDVDAALRGRLIEHLARTPLLAPADQAAADEAAAGEAAADEAAPAERAAGLVEPQRAVALAGPSAADLTRALAPWFAGLVVLAEGAVPAARALGVELREVADVVDELPAAAGLPPARWRALYAALAPAVADPLVRESLAALPVPLADGRVVRGARGLLLPVAGALDAHGPVAAALATLSRWGVRLVDPAAAHDVLERLGATPADPAALLAHPGVRQAVLDQADEDDVDLAEQVSDAVLTLVRAALADGTGATSDPDAPVPPGRALLGLLTLRAADGEPAPAHGLVLPGSLAGRLLDRRVLAPVGTAAVERWGTDVLRAVGVRADLVPLVLTDVVASTEDLSLGAPDDDADLVTDSLDGWDDYLADVAEVVGEGETLAEVLAVADLDAVDPGAWPDVLARLARPGALRRALLEPVRPSGASGAAGAEGARRAEAPGYTAWWIRHRAGIGLGAPFAAADAEPAVRRLLPGAPPEVAGLDPAVQAVLGGVDRLAAVPASGWNRLLRAAAPVGAPLDVALAAAVWSAWAALAGPDGDGPAELDVLPALVAPDRVALVHAEDAAVAPAPMWWQRTDVAAMVPVAGPADPEDLAGALGLPLAGDLAAGSVDEDEGDDAGGLADTPAAVRVLLPDAPGTWVEHEQLRVDGVPVDWWVEGAGPGATVHATHLAGLARGLAQASGAWRLRHAVELALVEPSRAAELAVEQVADAGGIMDGR